MAKKYIDADKLIHDLEERIFAYSEGYAEGDDRRKDAIETLLKDVRLECSLQQEQPCDTCTNDKGCVTCKDGELWEGKEQPCEDLNDEIKKFIEEYGYERGNDKLLIAIVARHFYELGKQSKEFVSDDLEEEIDSFWNKVSGFSPKFTTLEAKRNGLGVIARHFANWQKEQMLKDAVEGYVNYYENSGGILMAEAQVGCPYHEGELVKIVIVKEDKE